MIHPKLYIAALVAVSSLCLLAPTIHADDSHIQVQVSQSGMNKVANIGVDFLAAIFPGLSVSNLAGTYHWTFLGLAHLGNVDWKVKDVHFPSVTLPAATAVTNVLNGRVTWSMSGAEFMAVGKLNYTYSGLLGIRHTNIVNFDMKVKGVDISVDVDLNKTDAGLPDITVHACTCYIDDLDVTFHGVTDWLYNLFDDAIEHDLKSALRVTVCQGAISTVNTQGKQELASANLTIPLTSELSVTCELSTKPSIGTGLVKVSLTCELVIPGSPSIPFPFSPLPSISHPNKMLAIAISPALGNMIRGVLHNAKRYKYRLTKDNTPDGAAFLKGTDCTAGSNCCGALFPTFLTDYPGFDVDYFVVDVNTVMPPTETMATAGITVHKKLQVDVKAINSTTTEETVLLSVIVMEHRERDMSIVGLDIHFTRLALTYDSIVATPTGQPSTSIDALLAFAINNYYLKLTTSVTNKLKLPTTQGLTWMQPELVFYEGAMVFATNFQ